jgi:hypothetical protein
MTKTATGCDFTTESARAFRTAVRAAGENWAADDSGAVADLLAEAAGGDPVLAELVRTGGCLLEEFLEGYRRRRTSVDGPHDLAHELIEGRFVGPDADVGLASSYLIAIARWSGDDHGQTRDAETALCAAVDPDVLMTRRECGLVVLVPDTDPDRTMRITQQIMRSLDGGGWLATATRPRFEIPDGFREAADVLRLVTAARRRSGRYTVTDVLVEYAVVQDEAAMEQLVSLIGPLRDHANLRETLTAWIDLDYNRNSAARRLFVHRSTLDYRLQRIGVLTGCDPGTGHGAQMLTLAVVVDAVRARDGARN